MWTRQRGLTMSLGTGADPSKVAQYTTEDLDIFGFNMTTAEVSQKNNARPRFRGIELSSTASERRCSASGGEPEQAPEHDGRRSLRCGARCLPRWQRRVYMYSSASVFVRCCGPTRHPRPASQQPHRAQARPSVSLSRSCATKVRAAAGPELRALIRQPR